MATIRIMCTVAGKAPGNSPGAPTILTFSSSGGGVGHQRDDTDIRLSVDPAIAASFAVGNAVSIYITPTSGDKTALEAAVAITKASTKD